MSWILACIYSDIIDLVISFTTTAHELWTWIHTLYGPISLPPVNSTIQREVTRGSNIEEVSTRSKAREGVKTKTKIIFQKKKGQTNQKQKHPNPNPKNTPRNVFLREK